MDLSHPTEAPPETSHAEALIRVQEKLAELEQLDPADAPTLANEIADELAEVLDDVDEI